MVRLNRIRLTIAQGIMALQAIVYIVLMSHEQDYLVQMEKMNLFLATPQFFWQYTEQGVNGWVIYIACYLTQFFYKPWLGGLVYCLCCGLTMWLTAKALRLPVQWMGLLAIPLAWVLADGFCLGYQIYYSRVQGRLFVLMLWIALLMAVVWGMKSLLWKVIGNRLKPQWTFGKWSEYGKWTIVVQGVLLAIAVGVCYNSWYKDKTFYCELRMCNLADRQDWQGIVDEANRHQGEPSRVIVALRNLALFKLGKAGDKMFTYTDGAKRPNGAEDVHVAMVCGHILYLHYGMPNYCTRWCMEQGVKYGWSVGHLEYMTRAALLNGEDRLAQKYIDLLNKTLYHQWHHEPELEDIACLMDEEGFPGNDYGRTELFLISNLARVRTSNLAHAELALLAAMQTRDANLFWPAFFQYANLLPPDSRMQRHYQEAALLYGHLEGGPDISKMPFDAEVMDSYNRFMQNGWIKGSYYYYYYRGGQVQVD